ncbi:methylated-DNA--[protein]-cysteine S-methyltransferase [Nitrogeniibacter mangrovi]|uniref:methylated-DNA--[protein]-cysteine S-methyltransferase n=1 Tax=Nitrogeniibacter mangrovi TaxID=2016596 RepID=A0A6C1B5H8_9RHOO|nr:methylated-DNA--[protein]-cysteine S-methyltransferase [Nitrogeniibacter mangrovi]QID18941.1 methylated-DNA--[protein]-cysteine S-methyltransferase [Nitrogeniibacter mangrovi]
MPFAAILPAPFGALGIDCAGEQLAEIRFLPPGTRSHAPETPLAREACAQLARWLDDPTHAFDLPLRPAGTAFQRRVWAAIAAIPAGQVRTYGELSTDLESAARAVGQACGANPFPIVIPCHRVVARDALGGFANARGGFLIDTKRWLLRHERLA